MTVNKAFYKFMAEALQAQRQIHLQNNCLLSSENKVCSSMMEVAQYNQRGSWPPGSWSNLSGNAIVKDIVGLFCWHVGHCH